MSRLMITLFAAAGLMLGQTAAAQMKSPMTASTPMSKESHATSKTDAEAQYKLDKEACASLAGNAKDVCMAQAKGKDRIALAEADAAYKNTSKARADARIAHVQATYDVAVEKCDDLAGNPKDVCVKEANIDKQDAEYKVAIEKCDALAGTAKDSCVGTAKTKFGKS